MCRNIRPLFNFEPPATEEEIHNAALQFVRKVSGFSKPSKANKGVFYHTVSQIEDQIASMLDQLTTRASPKKREEEIAKARKRFERRRKPSEED